eukprot:1783686-Prymnesium_polylepis.2
MPQDEDEVKFHFVAHRWHVPRVPVTAPRRARVAPATATRRIIGHPGHPGHSISSYSPAHILDYVLCDRTLSVEKRG